MVSNPLTIHSFVATNPRSSIHAAFDATVMSLVNVLGVLGILFDWNGLAEPILKEMPIDPSEQDTTRSYICDRQGRILASNQNDEINGKLNLKEFDTVLKSPKGFFLTEFAGEKMCVGHAASPGFETYKTDWVSLVMQPVKD